MRSNEKPHAPAGFFDARTASIRTVTDGQSNKSLGKALGSSRFVTFSPLKKHWRDSTHPNEKRWVPAGFLNVQVTSTQVIVGDQSNGSMGRGSAHSRFLAFPPFKKCLQSSIHKNEIPKIPAGFFDAQMASIRSVTGGQPNGSLDKAFGSS